MGLTWRPALHRVSRGGGYRDLLRDDRLRDDGVLDDGALGLEHRGHLGDGRRSRRALGEDDGGDGDGTIEPMIEVDDAVTGTAERGSFLSRSSSRQIEACISQEAIERYLLAAASGETALARADDYDFRISLAGAQEKTALTWHRKRFCKPHGSTPTTHIIKLPSDSWGRCART